MGKDANKREDREFQLEVLKLQQISDSFNSIMTVLISIAISWMVASIAIIYSAGISSEVKLNFSLTTLSMFITLVVGCFVFVVVSFKFIPREIDKLRKHFVEPQAINIQTKQDKNEGLPMSNEDWEQLYYQELSEDMRHFRTMLWEIPAAIFLVDSFLLNLVAAVRLYADLQRTLIGFGLGFTIILTYSLLKAVKRSNNRIKELKEIEGKRGLSRYGMKEPSYLRFPLGYPMFILLAGVIAFLIILLIQPSILGSAIAINT